MNTCKHWEFFKLDDNGHFSRVHYKYITVNTITNTTVHYLVYDVRMLFNDILFLIVTVLIHGTLHVNLFGAHAFSCSSGLYERTFSKLL